MADTVDIHYLYPPNFEDAPNPSGVRKVVVQLTGLSDGSGETDITKIRLSDLMKHDGSTPTRTAIEHISYHIYGLIVQLEWDRAPNALIARLMPGSGEISDTKVDPGEDGDRTGDILLTSVGADSGDSYDIILTVRLK